MNKRTMIIITGVIAVLALVGTITWLNNGNNNNDSVAGGSKTDSTTPTTVVKNAPSPDDYLPSLTSKSGELVKISAHPYGVLLPQTENPLTEDDPGWLTSPPKGLEWQTSEYYMPMILGVSTSDGPTGFVENVPTGFAHTPQGAVLAAFALNSAQTGAATCPYTLKHLLYPAKSEEETKKKCAKYESMTEEGDDIPNAPPEAVEIRSYDGTSAALYFWFYHPEEPEWRRYIRREEYVVWIDGGWKLDKRVPPGRKRLGAEEIDPTASRWGSHP